MCFALFLAARVAPPMIPYSGKYGDGKVYTAALKDYNSPVRAHFTLPHVVYVGSDKGCGCGFRCAPSPGYWEEEDLVSRPDYVEETHPNQESLAALLREHFVGENFVELYGCWEGDFALPEKYRRDVTPAEIADRRFHFHEHEYCRVILTASPG